MAAARSRRAGKQQQQREAANTAESISMTVNEKILKDCHDLYISEKNGTFYYFIYFIYFILFFDF